MSNANLFESMVAFIKGLVKGSFGVCVDTITIPDMNKTGNPFWGRVEKHTHYSNVAIGYNYQNTVNNRLQREGKEANFVSLTPKGMHWATDLVNLFLQSDKDSSQYYLRLTFMANTKPTSVLYLDGREATPEECKQISVFIRSHSGGSSRQGLSEPNEVKVVNPKLQNIVRIYQDQDKRLWTRP